MAAPNRKGPPLLPSESGNRVVGPRRPKFREVMTSAYSSATTTSSTSTTSTSYSSSSNSIPSRWNPSPLVSRTVPTTPQPPSAAAAKRPQTPDQRRPNTPSPAPSAAVKRPDMPERRWPKTPSPAPSAVVVKRPPSTERRRPSTPGDSEERSKQLLGSLSRRSLSFSFHGDSLSLPVSKTKPAPASQVGSVWKATPERRRATENSKSIDQRRWAGLREVNSLTRSTNSDLKQSVMEDGKYSLVPFFLLHLMNDGNYNFLLYTFLDVLKYIWEKKYF